MSSFEKKYLVLAIASFTLQLVGLAAQFYQPPPAPATPPVIIQIDR